MVGLMIYSVMALWGLIGNRRIEQRCIIDVLIFGLIGFALGSLGFVPAIYWLFDLVRYPFGSLKALIP